MQIIETRRGARVLHAGHVVSELPRLPGPTHSVFDVMAALAAMLVGDGRLAMLGFAAGGVMAPLRALGSPVSVHAVDLDVTAVPVFQRVAGAWAGDVNVEEGEASAWLRAQSGRFEGIIEDLSQQVSGDVIKPDVSFNPLPGLIARKLDDGGVAIINLLPSPPRSQRFAAAELCAPHRDARAVRIDGFYNQILVGGQSLPPAQQLSRDLRHALSELGSPLANDCAVRTLER
ncbi:MAG: hypothetical protein ACT4TC_18135 [Myxococcaceae bacterium]